MQELDSLLQAVRIFSSDIGMQFEIIKYAVLELKWGKVMQSEEIQLPNGQKIKSLEGEKIYKNDFIKHWLIISKIKENCEKRHGSGKWLWKRETCKMLFKSRKIAKVI